MQPAFAGIGTGGGSNIETDRRTSEGCRASRVCPIVGFQASRSLQGEFPDKATML